MNINISIKKEDKDDMVKKLEKFLDELTELSLKHNITIGGCGCC